MQLTVRPMNPLIARTNTSTAVWRWRWLYDRMPKTFAGQVNII